MRRLHAPMHAPIDGVRARCLLGVLPDLDAFGGFETGFGVRIEHQGFGPCLIWMSWKEHLGFGPCLIWMSWKEHLGFGPGNERLRLHESYLLLHQADTGLHLGEDLRERAELVDLAEQLLKFSFHRQSFHFDTEDTGPA